MKNNKINSLQLGVIIFFFLFASLVGIGINSVTSLAGRDSFISIIIAYIIGLIPLIIFIYLFHQDKNIIELINNTFGKTIGMIINIILLIPIIIISACSLNSISNFLVSQLKAMFNVSIKIKQLPTTKAFRISFQVNNSFSWFCSKI